MENKAIAYLRTSSAANVGADKTSGARQREAIDQCARQHGYVIVAEYYDEAVSGAELIENRPGFKALLEHVAGNGVRTIIIEDPSRFARSMHASIFGEVLLKGLDVKVICANGEPLFEQEDDMRRAMSQIGMVFAELEKRKLVKRLQKGRDLKSKDLGRRVEGGSRQYSEDALTRAKALYRADRKGNRRTLRQIASELAKEGFTAPSGKEYQANSVRQMLQRAGVYKGKS
ncbi:recombinase family protein [Seohaeicola sp. SP36]|uniref:recombinase family protein n=1 Tax=unclassified Seohaeicola TaxID=2641111 RepID=UPI00237AF3FF|nr:MULTISPECIES: recombinase family protein [unclassified Seohaeicola]MDD9709716.1 recombinase family protein [Seohaeicola sp. 4SK31]MDD9736648.1 recombinase family protein [Seohaeicola sp. SP36]